MKISTRNKRVMVFGTFDILHAGHQNFFEQAKKMGDWLIVVVARDKTVLETKKQKTTNKEQKRLKVIKQSKLADEVVLGGLKDKYAVIRKYKPNFICLGYDQKFFIKELQDNLMLSGLTGTKIKRLKSYHPEIYKSSKLKN